jgi:PAS domain S-box-containing protein/putative nucleotidyltransferase with HDIG domain
LDITARKQAEEGLRLREAKLTSIFRAAPVGIGLVKNRVLTEVNEHICHLTGYSREELLGQSARLVYPSQEEFEGVGREKYRQIQETGMGTVETRWRRKDGTLIDVMLSSTPLVPGDLAGDITFTALNITQLKRAMEELQLKERLLDGASDSIFLHDLEGHFLYVNQAAYRERGYEKEELLATDLTALITPEFARMRESILTDLLARGEIIFETAHRRKDGSVMPVEIHARTIDLRDQQLILSAARDITERKQAEESLRETRDYLEKLIRYANAPIIVWSPESRVTQFNQAFEKLTGYQREEVIGRKLDMLLPEGTRDESLNQIELTLSGDYWDSVEIPIQRQDGETRLVLWNSANIYGPDAKTLVATMAQGQDITERKKGEQKIKELNVLLKAIKEINEALLRVKSEPDLFQQTCDLLMQAPNIRFTWIGLVQPGSFEIKPVAWAGYEAGYLSELRVTWDDSPHGGGAIGSAIRTGQPSAIEDIAGDPRALPWREASLKRGYSYMLALPLVHEDQTMGTLNVYSEKPKVFREDEIEFLQQVAGDIAVGIKSLRLAQGLEHSVKQLQVLMQQTVEAITSLAEMRDPYTAGHQQNVTRLALALAGELGLDEARYEGLRVAGLLHDIGKIVVPAEILSKPGKLSNMEFTIIKNHSQAGYDILKKIEFPWPVAQIVLQHHERLDGSGYPQGLAGQDILPEARILALADVVEAMSSHRPYRPALGIEKALEEISQNRGILYDPEVVDMCIKLIKEKGFHFD